MRSSLLWVPIDPTSFELATRAVLDWMEARQSRTAHFCNAHVLVSAQDDPALREALCRSSFNATDGAPLVWVARLRGLAAQRVAGPDLMKSVMDRGRARGARHYLYGSSPEVLARLEQRLTEMLPGLSIVGTWSPSFGRPTEAELEADIARIEATAADYVWVGLGAPKQELWVEKARERLDVAGLLAVGAAFDFLSGHRRRAPGFMQRLGLEWLFRLAIEPHRLWRRYAVTNTRFVYLALRELIGEAVHRATRVGRARENREPNDGRRPRGR